MDSSLEQAAVSSEAFFDPIRKFFNAGSNKGKDYKPVEQKHTYNNKALVTAIKRQYGDAQWLAKQNWVTGKVPAGDILPALVMGVGKPDPLAELVLASTFYVKTMKQWRIAMLRYYKDLTPALNSLVYSSLDDSDYIYLSKTLGRMKSAQGYWDNPSPPRFFPVMNRKLEKEHAKLKPLMALREPTKTKALTKDEVQALVKQMLQTLEETEQLRETILAEATAKIPQQLRNKIYQLAHLASATPPKDSQYSLEQWRDLAKRLDPTTIYWSSGTFTTTRTCYSDLVLALCRLIDRSIR